MAKATSGSGAQVTEDTSSTKAGLTPQSGFKQRPIAAKGGIPAKSFNQRVTLSKAAVAKAKLYVGTRSAAVGTPIKPGMAKNSGAVNATIPKKKAAKHPFHAMMQRSSPR